MDHTLNDSLYSASQTITHHGLSNEDNNADTNELTDGVDTTNTTGPWTDSSATTDTTTPRQSSPNPYYSLAEDALSEETLLALGIDINEIRAQQEIERRLKQEAEQLKFAKRLQMEYNMEILCQSSSASTSTLPVRNTSVVPLPVSPAIPVDKTQLERDASIPSVTNTLSMQPGTFLPNRTTHDNNASSSNSSNSADQRNNKRKLEHPASSSNSVVIPSSVTSTTSRQNGKKPKYQPISYQVDSDSDSDSVLDPPPITTSQPASSLLPLRQIPTTTSHRLILSRTPPTTSQPRPLSNQSRTLTAKNTADLMEKQVLLDLQTSHDDDNYTSITPIEPSSDLKVDLLYYQKDGYHWMCQQEESDTKGGLLADDVGLGKTIQSLALITGRPCTDADPLPSPTYSIESSSANISPFKIKSTLIVCPTSLVEQWAQEIRSKTENVSVYVHYGPKRLTSRYSMAEFDVIVTSYGVLKAESDKLFSKTHGPIYGVIFHRVILDEAHTIKNPRTELTKSCISLLTTYRWCLTATPIQGKLSDLQSLVRFLEVKPYCDPDEFRRVVTVPMSKGEPVMGTIQSILKSISLRRTKSVLNGDQPMLTLPAKKEHIIRADFSEPEQQAYNLVKADVEREFRLHVGSSVVMTKYTCALMLLTRLRQSCLHPTWEVYSPIITHTEESIYTRNARLLSPTVVNRLKRLMEDNEAIECPICMDTAQDPKIIPGCGHIFCCECLHSYVVSRNIPPGVKSCPECRGPLHHDRAVPVNTFIDIHLSAAPNPRTIQVAQTPNVAESTKINLTIDILNKTREQSDKKDKTIIFTQYSFMMGMIAKSLKANRYRWVAFSGSDDAKKRAKILQEFTDDPTVEVLLMSTKSGAVGLNLTMANHVILVDVGWNSVMEDQAVGRVHRLGQTKPVHIYRLFINNTVEDRISELHEKRKQMAASAFGEGNFQGLNRLGMPEMKYLICGGVSPFNTVSAGPST